MKTYLYILYLLVSPLLLCVTLSASEKSLFVVTIQFPTTIKNLPGIRCYCGGVILPCDIDTKTNRMSFTVEASKYRTLFDLVITPSLIFQTVPLATKDTPNNTCLYLKVLDKKAYLYYTLELVPILKLASTPSQTPSSDNIADLFNETPQYSWRIKEQQLPHGQIPDEAIIVCIDSDLVSHLSTDGTSSVELPKIIINKDCFASPGAEQAFHDRANQTLLELLLIDTFHAHTTREIYMNSPKKTIIAMNS